MLKILFGIFILTVASCASQPTYVCTSDDKTYYADNYSAIVVTEDKILLGDCKAIE